MRSMDIHFNALEMGSQASASQGTIYALIREGIGLRGMMSNSEGSI